MSASVNVPVDVCGYSVTPVPGEGSHKTMRPEEELLAAVLRQAMEDHEKYSTAEGGAAQQIWAEVDMWFRSGSLEQQSFLWVCDILGLDADYVRRQLRDRTEGPRRSCAAA